MKKFTENWENICLGIILVLGTIGMSVLFFKFTMLVLS